MVKLQQPNPERSAIRCPRRGHVAPHPAEEGQPALVAVPINPWRTCSPVAPRSCSVRQPLNRRRAADGASVGPAVSTSIDSPRMVRISRSTPWSSACRRSRQVACTPISLAGLRDRRYRCHDVRTVPRLVSSGCGSADDCAHQRSQHEFASPVDRFESAMEVTADDIGCRLEGAVGRSERQPALGKQTARYRHFFGRVAAPDCASDGSLGAGGRRV